MFARRTRRLAALRTVVPVTPLVVVIEIALVMLATSAAILASITPWELTLLVLVLRPMLAFTFVLASIGREEEAS